jgi:hypothetical protein
MVWYGMARYGSFLLVLLLVVVVVFCSCLASCGGGEDGMFRFFFEREGLRLSVRKVRQSIDPQPRNRKRAVMCRSEVNKAQTSLLPSSCPALHHTEHSVSNGPKAPLHVHTSRFPSPPPKPRAQIALGLARCSEAVPETPPSSTITSRHRLW